MHKQKLHSVLRRSQWFGFLLLFLLTMTTQMLPFLAQHASAADVQDVVKAEWANSTGINVSVSNSKATFDNTNISVKTVLTGGYVYVGDGYDTETVLGQKGLHVFRGNNGNPYSCKNAGVTHSRNGRGNLVYNSIDDDTTRLDVSGAGATTGVLRIRFNPTPSKSDVCAGMDINIPITQPATGGSGVVGKWLDSANIQTTIYPGIYHIDPTNSKHFISKADNQGDCKDILVITGNDDANGTPVMLYDQKKGSGSPVNKDCGLDGSSAGYITNSDQAETAPPDSGLNDSLDTDPSCESSGSTVLNWVFCAVIDAIDGTVSAVNGIVDNMLSMDTNQIQNNDELHTLWSYFRNIASLLLVVVALAMIIAQSLGNG